MVERIERLLSGSVLAQQPVPKMRRLVANIEIEKTSPDELTVASNFILASARAGGRSYGRVARSTACGCAANPRRS